MDSSSDESVDEEIPVGVLRIPEMPSAAYGLKPVLDDIFADIQANIPSLDLEDSSGESSDGKERVAFPSKQWSLLHSNVSEVIPPGSELILSPAESTTDSGMSLISQDIQTTSSSSLSDCDQDSIEFHSTSPMPQDSEETSSNQTISPDIIQAGKQLYSLGKVYEENILDKKIEPTSCSSPGSSQQGFALKFDLIEQLHLGHLLENTSEVSVSQVFPPLVGDSELSDIDARITESSDNLMEALVLLSRKQQDDAAPEPDKQFDKYSKRIVSTLDQPRKTMRASVGVTACPSEARSNDTVFLDLRNQRDGTCDLRHQTLPSSISRILGIGRGTEDGLSSSSDGEDDLAQWQHQRLKVKEASVSCGRETNGTSSQEQADKQTILKTDFDQGSVFQTIHGRETAVKQIPFTRDIQTSVVKQAAGIDTLVHCKTVKQEQMEIKDVKSTEKAVAEFDSSMYYETVKQNEENIHPKSERRPTEFKHVPEEKESDTENILKEIEERKEAREMTPPAEEKSESVLAKKDEVVHLTPEKGCSNKSEGEVRQTKQLITQEERFKRQRLHKSLQSLKDHFSSQAFHPPAPSTPVVFHEEASYESTISSLPRLEKLEQHSSLLLCAKLSSCGELAVIRQGPRGMPSPDTYCISALVAWLTCLVPVPYGASCVDYAEVCGVPFHVVGLQQSWHDGQLSLEVGICSRASKTEEPSGQETKRKNKASCGFKQTVSKFLSTNTLRDVFCRLSEFTSLQKMCLSDVMISKRNLSTLLTVNPDPCAVRRVLGAVPGFFWQTVEVEDTGERTGRRFCQSPEVQNTVMLMRCDAYHEPACVLDVLIRANRQALDLAGIRLSYQWQEMLEEKPAFRSQCLNWWTREQSQMPLLALALRGPQAITRWQDEVGPADAKLAQRTDPSSLRALYSNGTRDDRLFWCPRNIHSADAALVRWFGGRVPASGVINVGCDQVTNRCPHRGQTGNSHLTSAPHSAPPRPPCFLIASTGTCVFFFVSPIVPVRIVGHVLCTCYQRGFSIQGIRRIHLNVNRLNGLGLSQEQMSVFCPKRTNLSESRIASTVLLLSRENALHNVFSLTESLATDLAGVSTVQCSLLAVPYSDWMLKQLGGNFSQTPNPAAHSLDLMRHTFHSSPELEQVCVVTLLKEKATMSAGTILKQLLIGKELQKVGDMSSEKSQFGFELLGLKFLPSLSMYQAKEFTPCEIGDKLWQSSLRTLTSSPALIIALRGTDAFSRVSHFINSHKNSSILKPGKKDGNSLDMFVSCTPELAYRQLEVIFFDRELFSDQSARRSLHLLPPPRRVIGSRMSGSSESVSGAVLGNPSGGKSQRCLRALLGKSPLKSSLTSVETLCHGELSALQSLLATPRPIPTVCLLKPCTAAKHLGKVLKRLAQEGFTVINMKMMLLSTLEVFEMMMKKEADLERHVSYMTSGPVVVLCLQRENAVGRLLDLLGPSDPVEAKRKSQFFLRGSFGQDSVRNALYGSETYEDAIRDVKLLFPEGVCCPSTMDLRAEGIPCLALDEVVSFTAIRTLTELSAEEQACFDGTPEITRSLLEINCLLLMPQLLTCCTVPGRKANPSFAEIIEALLSAGFHIIGLRMVLLGEPEAAECAKLLSGSLPSDWTPDDLVSKLSQPSCVVMAVLRDNAVTCFDSLCDSFPKLKSFANNYGKYVLAGKTVKEANRLVERFFDHLMPNRKAKLICNDR